jgi:predicted nucleic acid-binding protein
MSRVVLLDAGVLGLLITPAGKSAEAVDCARWLAACMQAGKRVHVPKITDYEVRRELIRLGKAKAISQLDALAVTTEYLPLTTAAMRKAAELWAQARQTGQPTSGDKTIDADIILAAQAHTLGVADVVVATTNVGHLGRFVPAENWQNITP